MSAEMPAQMPANREFQSLLQNLITDVQEATVLWQIAVLVASLGLAWLFQRQFERRAGIQAESKSRALNISVRRMGRLLFPLFALAFVIPGDGCSATGTPRISLISWFRCCSRSP